MYDEAIYYCNITQDALLVALLALYVMTPECTLSALK